MNNYNEEETFYISLEIGAALIESGGEIKRSEDTVNRINNSSGAKTTEVMALPSMIAATTTTASGKVLTKTKRIGEEDINLSELDRLNSLSRRICSGETIYFDITRNTDYPLHIRLLSTFLATFAFCIYFSGSIIDGIFAGFIGIIISNYRHNISSSFSSVLLDSTVAGILSFMPIIFGFDCKADKIIIGTIMLLVPGLTVSNAMTDIIMGDVFAGIMRLINAICCALAIALGFSFAVLLFGSEYL